MFLELFLLKPSPPSLFCSFTLSVQLCGSEGSFHVWQNLADSNLQGLFGCNMLNIFIINALWSFELISLQTETRCAFMPKGLWDESLL